MRRGLRVFRIAPALSVSAPLPHVSSHRDVCTPEPTGCMCPRLSQTELSAVPSVWPPAKVNYRNRANHPAHRGSATITTTTTTGDLAHVRLRRLLVSLLFLRRRRVLVVIHHCRGRFGLDLLLILLGVLCRSRQNGRAAGGRGAKDGPDVCHHDEAGVCVARNVREGVGIPTDFRSADNPISFSVRHGLTENK